MPAKKTKKKATAARPAKKKAAKKKVVKRTSKPLKPSISAIKSQQAEFEGREMIFESLVPKWKHRKMRNEGMVVKTTSEN